MIRVMLNVAINCKAPTLAAGREISHGATIDMALPEQNMTPLAPLHPRQHPQGICSWHPLVIAAAIIIVLLSVTPLPPEEAVALTPAVR